MALSLKALHNYNMLHKAFRLIPIFVIGFIPILWFLPNHVVFFGDEYPYWTGKAFLEKEFFSWDDFNLGQRSSLPAYIIHDSIGGSLRTIGLDIGLITVLEYSFIILVAGVSIYLLFSKTIQVQNDIKVFAYNIGALFYVANVHVIVMFFNKPMLYGYAFTPLLSYLSIRLMDDIAEGRRPYKSLFILMIASLFSLPFISLNPAILLITSIIVLVFVGYHAASRSYFRKLMFLRGFAFCILLFVLANSWWIYLAFAYYERTLHQDVWQTPPEVAISSWSWTHQNAQIERLLNLSGHWDFNEINYPFFNFYENAWIWALMYLPFVFFACAYIFNKAKSPNRTILYTMVLLLLTGLFFAKGINEPFSSINKALYEKSFIFNMFREPVSKFTFLIITAFSFGAVLFSIKILRFNKKRMINLVLFLSITMILLIPSYPMLNGSTLKQPRYEKIFDGASFKPYNEIPSYWLTMDSYFDDISPNGDFKVVVFPYDGFYQQGYKWGSYGIDSLARANIANPVVTSTQDNYIINPNIVEDIKTMYATFGVNKDSFLYYLDKLNIKYLLVRNDYYSDLPGRNTMSAEQVKTILNGMSEVQYLSTIGRLDIYEYKYAKPEVAIDSGHMSLRKIDPTSYHLTVSNMEDIATIYLSQSYDPLWKASYGDHNWFDMLFTTPINKDFRRDDYRNIWIFSASEMKNENITIQYLGQSYLILFSIVSASVFGIISFVAFLKHKVCFGMTGLNKTKRGVLALLNRGCQILSTWQKR